MRRVTCGVALVLLGCAPGAAPGCGPESVAIASAPNEVGAEAAPQSEPATVPAASPPPGMLERLIPYDEERCRLTIDYLRRHNPDLAAGRAPASCDMEPRLIVIHWTGGRTMEDAWATFAPGRLSGRLDLAGAGVVNVSAHFLVGQDGSIFKLMPETRVARHVIGLNHLAIGIENVGGLPDLPLTDAQVAADAALVRWLAGTQPVTRLIGHHEYRSLEGTPWFQEADPSYRTGKADPGAAFMAAVRREVADLGLAGAEGGRGPGTDRE